MPLHLQSFAADEESLRVGVRLLISGCLWLSPRLLRSIRLANVAHPPVRVPASETAQPLQHFRVPDLLLPNHNGV